MSALGSLCLFPHTNTLVEVPLWENTWSEQHQLMFCERRSAGAGCGHPECAWCPPLFLSTLSSVGEALNDSIAHDYMLLSMIRASLWPLHCKSSCTAAIAAITPICFCHCTDFQLLKACSLMLTHVLTTHTQVLPSPWLRDSRDSQLQGFIYP